MIGAPRLVVETRSPRSEAGAQLVALGIMRKNGFAENKEAEKAWDLALEESRLR